MCAWCPALWCCDDYFGGRPEALFSPFPYWWWRRCLLWPPVWWCTLHLHNVSVTREKTREDQRREVLLRHDMILLTPFSHCEWDTLTRDKKILFRGSKAELGAVRYSISVIRCFFLLISQTFSASHPLLAWICPATLNMNAAGKENEWINEIWRQITAPFYKSKTNTGYSSNSLF